MNKKIKNKIRYFLKDVVDNRGRNPENYFDSEKYPVIDNFLIENKIYPDLKKVKRYINQKTYDLFLRKYLEKDDVLITLVGNGFCSVSLSPSNEVVIIQNTIGLQTNEKLYNKFLYYYLILQQKNLVKLNRSSSQPSLNQQDLLDYEIEVPENIQDQQKIASILFTLDAKIELNNRINAELEQMAKTLYEYWFVQFDFPDKNGDPYKTSGGKMVWNKELKKEIPDGWEDKKLKDILKKNNKRFNLNGDKYNIDTIDLSVMPSSTMCLTGKNTSDKFGTNLFEMSRFDILFGGIRPYLLKAGFAPFDGLVTGTVHSFKIIKDFNYNFALLTITHNNVFKFAVSNSKGTKMPVISSDDLLEYKFAYEENVVKKFNELISFKEIISKNITENHKLAELRDWLLPMLMNGQVSIK